MGAIYKPNQRLVYITIHSGSQGWSVAMPEQWTIAQIERYIAELRLLYAC